jgi:hypothetical protein
MEWKDLGQVVGKAAPMLGTLIGGPAGAAIGSIIASAIGTQATPDAVEAALASNPDALIRLRQMEANRTVRLQELIAEQAKAQIQAETADRASARQMQTAQPSRMPALLTCGVGLGFLLTLAALFWLPIPAENRDTIVYMCGQLAAAFAACLAFWVGTTRQSENKTQMLAQASPIK